MTFAVLACCLAAAPPAPVGSRVADFTRPDARTGTPWVLNAETKTARAAVIAFLGAGCPASVAYVPRLNELAKRHAADGVVFVAVNSQSELTAAESLLPGLGFPMLKDDGTTLADRFAVDRVPAVIVLDGARTVRYAGRIDDQFAPNVHKPKATTRELGNAIDAVLEGRAVTVPAAPAAGCKLTKATAVKKTATTYHGHAAAVFAAKCVECHRAGEAGPFPLTGYKQAKGWAGMIREVVADGVMPPWHADAPPGHFANDRRLTAAEKTTLLDWIDGGCAEGEAPKPAAAKAAAPIDGWRLPRTPDQVFALPKPVNVPASGYFGTGVPYQYHTANELFDEDKWVTGVEVRPGYRAVVHHVIAFVVPEGMKLQDLGGREFGRYLLGAYVPGDQPVVLPSDTAMKVKKGSRLLFELHYTPNGTPGPDNTTVGLTYTAKPPAREMKNMSIMTDKFAIPPGAANHTVTASYTFKKPATLYSMTPHMHVRGKAFKYELITKGADGKDRRELLLNVPKYDFNWQVAYNLSKPATIPAGARIECTAWYDNSKNNPVNPDPTKEVTWGDQTWEEMMIGFVSYTEGK